MVYNSSMFVGDSLEDRMRKLIAQASLPIDEIEILGGIPDSYREKLLLDILINRYLDYLNHIKSIIREQHSFYLPSNDILVEECLRIYKRFPKPIKTYAGAPLENILESLLDRERLLTSGMENDEKEIFETMVRPCGSVNYDNVSVGEQAEKISRVTGILSDNILRVFHNRG